MGKSPGREGTHRTSILTNAATVCFYPGNFAPALTTLRSMQPFPVLFPSPIMSSTLFGPLTALT